MDKPANIPVRVSISTFLRVLAVVLALLLLWALRDVILLLFLAMILAAAIGPWIAWFGKFKIPRTFGVLIVYVGIVAIFFLAIGLLIPAISHELASIPDRFPQYSTYYEKVREFFFAHDTAASSATAAAKEGLPALTRGIFAGLRGFIGGVGSFLLVLVMTYYFTVDEDNVRRFWVRMTPAKYRERMQRILSSIGERIGHWFRGQLTIAALIGAVSYLVFMLIGIPDALLLALIAALASFIPIVGAAIGIIPAVFIALTVSVPAAIGVLTFTIAVNWIIANALVPRVMSKAVGLNPVVIVLVMLLGAEFAGGLGLILAIPVASIIDAVVTELGRHRDGEATA